MKKAALLFLFFFINYIYNQAVCSTLTIGQETYEIELKHGKFVNTTSVQKCSSCYIIFNYPSETCNPLCQPSMPFFNNTLPTDISGCTCTPVGSSNCYGCQITDSDFCGGCRVNFTYTCTYVHEHKERDVSFY